MPINDSAGVGVYLIDKSQRASAAIGFHSAGAIEADRGLCNTPTLISSEDDYVKTFGTPSMERHGSAAMEAYMLAQRKVPQVLTRAKNPEIKSTDTCFGLMRFYVDTSDDKNVLKLDTTAPASAVRAPVNSNETFIYFKGEGDYCSKAKNNIAVRFSTPITQSAYAKDGQSIRMQVFDFDGADHIDEDVTAEFAFNPDVSAMIDTTGKFKLDGYTIGSIPEDTKVTITTYVNGRVGKDSIDYSTIASATSGARLFDAFSTVAKTAEYSNGRKVINGEWAVPLTYTPSSNGGYGTYMLYSGKASGPQELNCFGLSIAITAEVELPVTGDSINPGFYGYPCGSVTIAKKSDGTYTAKFSLSTNLYLKNRNAYMFMGSHEEQDGATTKIVQDNSNWASYYSNYCKEDYTFSLSYDDFDANYVSMQVDASTSGSNYVISKSSDTFVDYEVDSNILSSIQYFDSAAETVEAITIKDNILTTANKSYAYSNALSILLGDNLTRWRCVATPNLGDVMNTADFISAISAANESTLGLSNIGRAASTDVLANLSGRHGNRFIADYSQYAYRTLAGKRTAVTMASLVADLLNSHYNEGLEARPPFGYNYGQISCIGLSQQFSGAERSVIARQHKINPVIEDGGYYIWEERTSQITDTSLSDIHCIISFIWMKFAIYDAMKSFVAEYNDASTVNRGLTVLNQLNQTFISRNYIEEGLVSADKNVLGDEVLRFDYAVRFKGVARFVDVYITAYSQTQTLAVSLAQEA